MLHNYSDAAPPAMRRAVALLERLGLGRRAREVVAGRLEPHLVRALLAVAVEIADRAHDRGLAAVDELVLVRVAVRIVDREAERGPARARPLRRVDRARAALIAARAERRRRAGRLLREAAARLPHRLDAIGEHAEQERRLARA